MQPGSINNLSPPLIYVSLIKSNFCLRKKLATCKPESQHILYSNTVTLLAHTHHNQLTKQLTVDPILLL